MSHLTMKLLSALLASLVLVGCGGDNGRTGDPGVAGIQGPPGQDGEDGQDAPNQDPLVSAIEDQTITANVDADPIGFLVFDDRTNADELTVVATSDNQDVIADGDIDIDGEFVTRSLVIAQAPTQTGSANITITVTDADGSSTQSAFTVIVDPQMVSTTSFVTQVFNDNANAMSRDLNSRILVEDAEGINLYDQLVP